MKSLAAEFFFGINARPSVNLVLTLMWLWVCWFSIMRGSMFWAVFAAWNSGYRMALVLTEHR